MTMEMTTACQTNQTLSIDNVSEIVTLLRNACQRLSGVNPSNMLEEALQQYSQGFTVDDIRKGILIKARSLIKDEPNYSYVAARLLLDQLRSEAFNFLEIKDSNPRGEANINYAEALPRYIQKGIELRLLSSELALFDSERLASAIVPNRDRQFNYPELQLLYDRYLIQNKGTRFELPQLFYMRLAMGLAMKHEQKEQQTIKFYHMLSNNNALNSFKA